MTSEERAKRATELLFDLGRVPDTAKEREALLCVTKAALQPGARHQTVDGEWFRWLQDYLKGVFRPSGESKGPDTPAESVEAGSGAPSGFVGCVTVTGGGVNAVGMDETPTERANQVINHLVQVWSRLHRRREIMLVTRLFVDMMEDGPPGSKVRRQLGESFTPFSVSEEADSGSGESEYDAAIKRGEPLIAEAPVPDDESEPERTCGECAHFEEVNSEYHTGRCKKGHGKASNTLMYADTPGPVDTKYVPACSDFEPQRAFVPPDENREGNVCGDCTLCLDVPLNRSEQVCPLIDKKPARGPGIIPPGNLVGDMKPEPKPERMCGEYRGGHYYEPCPPGDIACSGFKPKAERHPGYPVLIDWEDGRGPQRLGGMINFDRKPGPGEHRQRDWLTFEPGKIADVKILVD